MSHPDDEALAELALEPDHASPSDVDHLGSCGRCAAVVAQLRDVRDLARDAGTPQFEHPDPLVWEAIERHVADGALGPLGQDEAAGAGGTAPIRAPSGPSASATRAGGRSRREPSRRRSFSATWLVAAAAAGIIVGMVAAWSFWKAPTTPTTIARTQLDTLDTRQARGVAVLEGTGQGLDLRVDAASLNADGGYLEVWLLNTDGKRMISVGMLREPGSDLFPVPQTAIREGYVIVDISREPFDDKPAHSGDSLARGRLPA